jgi:predicted Fe-Mo cluster-binding NifX family protein
MEGPTGRVSKHFGEAPYFAIIVIGLTDLRIEKREIVANPYCRVEKAKGIRVAEWLVEKNVDELVVKEEDIKNRGPGYMLSSAGVKVHVLSEDQPDEDMESLIASAPWFRAIRNGIPDPSDENGGKPPGELE